MATIQDALPTLCPGGPIKSEYPLTMEAIGQVRYRFSATCCV